MNTRPATISDADAIARFNLLLARESENLSLDPAVVNAGVRAILSDQSKGSYFVAEIDGQLVGQIMITREWSDWRNGDIWWIQSVYVDANFRRRGIFKSLYKLVLDRAKDAGAVGVRLYVDADNAVAQNTYTSLGMNLTHYKLMERMFAAS